MNSDMLVCDVRMQAPLRPAGAGAVTRRLILLRLFDDDFESYGEAAPLEEYDGVSLQDVGDAFRAYGPVLRSANGIERDEILTACSATNPLPQALAAVDMALWDLAGRRAGKSVAELLGAPATAAVAVNATIGAVAPVAAADEAKAAQQAGFACIKVKVGTPDDRQRLQAIREAVGPDMLIRVDANGAWDRLTAPERIRALARFDIELFEEPVHGPEATEAVARAVPKIALALDESASAILGSHARRLCDAVCLKISSSGGISGLIAEAERARAVGYEVYLASTLDGPLGIAAALHAAAAVRPDRHCGLATLGRFERAVPEALVPAGGQMRMPAGPGLGDGLLGWYRY